MPSEFKRYALVRGLSVTPEKVAAYLPSGYKVSWSGKTDWHYSHYTSTWKRVEGMVEDVVLIEGRDYAGWTLDKYVAPRLGSGGMRCDEIDMSHPALINVPV